MVTKDIPSCPGYSATADGSILRNGRPPKQSDNGHGYKRVGICIAGKKADRYVHRLVCEAFHGAPGTSQQARHLDGCRSHNAESNLAWGDRVQNQADKNLHGTLLQGEAVSSAVLTESVVVEARRLARQGMPYDQVAGRLGYSERLIADAISGRRWAHIPGALPACFSRRRFSDDEVRSIRALRGVRPESEIAAEAGVARNTIWQIMTGRSYANVR